MLALSPQERGPSSPHHSGTLHTASKYFKLLLLCSVSARPAECTRPPQVTEVSAPRSTPTFFGVQPHESSNPNECGLILPQQLFKDRCDRFLSIYPLPTRCLSFLFTGLDGRRAWLMIYHGSAPLPFSLWSSSPSKYGLF